MKTMEKTIKQLIEKTVNIKTLCVQAGVRYWEDSTVDGMEDIDGDLIPCRDGDYWCPNIDVDTGQITNWKQGVKAEIHYKVCDDGVYYLLDENGDILLKKEGYVPDCLAPNGEGYGDYIIFHIDDTGKILNWTFTDEHLKEFEPEEE